jgi:hypothetical protein
VFRTARHLPSVPTPQLEKAGLDAPRLNMENPMTRNGKVLAAAAVVLTLGSVAALAHRHGGWNHERHHGWGGGPGMFGLARPVCRGNPAEMADLMMVRLEYRVKPTESQKATFEELKTAVKSAAEIVAAACPAKPNQAAERKDQPAPRKDVTARLADTEAQLTAALEGLRLVRPAAEKLYASLDEAQKNAVSEFRFGRHAKGHRQHGRWGHHGHDGEQGGRPDRGGAGSADDDGSPAQ